MNNVNNYDDEINTYFFPFTKVCFEDIPGENPDEQALGVRSDLQT